MTNLLHTHHRIAITQKAEGAELTGQTLMLGSSQMVDIPESGARERRIITSGTHAEVAATPMDGFAPADKEQMCFPLLLQSQKSAPPDAAAS